ncbi:unnamed protein product [Arctia plantaginis]|uniref:Carboxylesterase type B domain-containing protein n=1 Tax=Arctia plantaginis TaxID=874455 RepID=A0A8S1BFB1_ARCPL|nr:unnamed protein product [Arctia plantaginis]
MASSARVCVFILLCAYAHGLQVNTTEGIVEGRRAVDGDYFTFNSIPYAGPTDGANRFKSPTPPAPYPALLNTTETTVICAQPTERGLIGVENCLFLNIFTRNVTTPKPVIVWLNADDYTNTNLLNQQYSFRRFVEQDIVFVSMNFRLSVFGFLCLGVQEAPGNAGLKDVIQGLRWINANIANFGGNPNNVVLMGHASGAAMVDLLTMTSQTQGLIHKAIALSGSALAPWAVAYDPVGYAELFGSRLGYSGKSREDLAKHLVSTDINVLQTALREFSFQNNTPLFAPCIENLELNPNDTVLIDAPINILQSGNFLPVPYISGYTTREGTMRASQAASGEWLDAMQTNFTEFLPVDLNLSNNQTVVTASIRDFYFDTKPVSMETIEDFLDYQGDTLIVVSVIRGARERSLQSTGEVRLLEFGYMGTRLSDWFFPQIPLGGVRHGGLLNFLFDYDLRPADESVMRSIVRRFIGFAYTGVPNILGDPLAPTWPAITRDDLTYYIYEGIDMAAIGNPVAIHDEELRFNPHNITMTFWNDILARYYVPPRAFNSSGKVLSSITFIMMCQMVMRLF